MSDSGLGCVVRTVERLARTELAFMAMESSYGLRLGLGHVDDGARHAADHDDATRALALHEVASDGGGEEVGAVDVDSPELAHAINGVVDGLKVLGEASRGDEVVDLSVGSEDLGDAGLDGLGVRDVGVVGGDLGDSGTLDISLALIPVHPGVVDGVGGAEAYR